MFLTDEPAPVWGDLRRGLRDAVVVAAECACDCATNSSSQVITDPRALILLITGGRIYMEPLRVRYTQIKSQSWFGCGPERIRDSLSHLTCPLGGTWAWFPPPPRLWPTCIYPIHFGVSKHLATSTLPSYVTLGPHEFASLCIA